MITPIPSAGVVSGSVRTWLRIEGLAALTLSALVYWQSGAHWPIFFGLLLVPDLSMLPYLLNPRLGAISYNTVHSYFLPLLLGTLAVIFRAPWIIPYACIWTAHIGLDRMLGYGLKYPTTFGSTHLGTMRK